MSWLKKIKVSVQRSRSRPDQLTYIGGCIRCDGVASKLGSWRSNVHKFSKCRCRSASSSSKN